MKQILDGVIVSNYLERALNHFVFDTAEELNNRIIKKRKVFGERYWFQFYDGVEWLLLRPEDIIGRQYKKCIILPDVTDRQIEKFGIKERVFTNE